MKFLRILPLVLLTIFASCTNNDTPEVNELDGLTKFKEITNTTHTIELYKHMGGFEQGFNEIALKIKDKATNQYINNATVTWMPVMHMAMMKHSCPKSPVTKVSTDGLVYEGFIVFQMAQNATEYWDLKIDYTINGVAYSITSVVDVPPATKQKVTSFTGSDNVRYIAAYVDPHHPKVGINDMVVGVWKMQDMMTFPVVDNFKLKFDPRMPSMGNHIPGGNDAARLVLRGAPAGRARGAGLHHGCRYPQAPALEGAVALARGRRGHLARARYRGAPASAKRPAPLRHPQPGGVAAGR